MPNTTTIISNYCQFGLQATYQGECGGPFRPTMGAKYGEYSQYCGTYLYSEIQRAGFDECFDNVTMTNIGYAIEPKDGFTSKGVWMSYQGPESVQAIVEFAKAKNLRGVFAFDISGDSILQNGTFTYELTKEIAKMES